MLFTWEINSKQIEQQQQRLETELETRVTLSVWVGNVNLITNCGEIFLVAHGRTCRNISTLQCQSFFWVLWCMMAKECAGRKFKIEMPTNAVAKVLGGGFGFGTTIYDYSLWVVAHNAFWNMEPWMPCYVSTAI